MIDALPAIAEVGDVLKSALDLLKAFRGTRDATPEGDRLGEVYRMVGEAQQRALAAYADQLAMTKRIDSLEKQVLEYETWETEKARYALERVSTTFQSFAYAVKEDARAAEPAHRICASCFQRREKTILQERPVEGDRRTNLHCTRCDFTILAT